jgi:hypothetical protein
MKPEDEVINLGGVRFYLAAERLLALERPFLEGEALRIALFPKLEIAARSFRDREVTWDWLQATVAEAFRGFLEKIAASPEAAALRGQSYEVASVIPCYYLTCEATYYWAVAKPTGKVGETSLRRGNDIRRIPPGEYEFIELLVPFSYSLVACLSKS